MCDERDQVAGLEGNADGLPECFCERRLSHRIVERCGLSAFASGPQIAPCCSFLMGRES